MSPGASTSSGDRWPIWKRKATRLQLSQFGENLGLAFQIIDDILDVTQTAAALGKSPGKDAAANKATYPALIGLDAARAEAAKLTTAALANLEPFGKKAGRLRQIAEFLLQRES